MVDAEKNHAQSTATHDCQATTQYVSEAVLVVLEQTHRM